MTRRLFLGWALSMASILALLPDVAQSDVYLKQKQHTGAMSVMGRTQPAQDVISEVWITPGKMASSSEKQTVIIDLSAKTIAIADHEKKTLMTMPLDFSSISAQTGMGAKEQADFQQFMGKMMSFKISVQPTSEKKTIGRWNCQKYIQVIEMGMGTVTSEIWASRDIRIDPALYAKYSAAMLAQMPGLSQNMKAAVDEMKKIKGVHVFTKQTTKMMGQSFDATTELVDFKEGAAPKAVFQLPKGYARQKVFK